MRWGHEVECSSPPRLLFEKNLCKPLHRNFLPFAAMTDFMVLAIYTAQIAVGEKDCTSAPLSY
jgi:hypothetical protein